MGYLSEAGVPGYNYGGIATFGANGEGYFYPGIWVAI
jgi:hypothetical protein